MWMTLQLLRSSSGIHTVKFRASAAVEQWSSNNKLQLNADKCKETIIDLKLVKNHFDCVPVNTKELKLVDHSKLLGVTTCISNNGTIIHISDVIKRANKRLFFLIDHHRLGKQMFHLLIHLYILFLLHLHWDGSQVLCASVFHHALPEYSI